MPGVSCRPGLRVRTDAHGATSQFDNQRPYGEALLPFLEMRIDAAFGLMACLQADHPDVSSLLSWAEDSEFCHIINILIIVA